VNARDRRRARREHLRLVPPGIDARRWQTMVADADGDPAAEESLLALRSKLDPDAEPPDDDGFSSQEWRDLAAVELAVEAIRQEQAATAKPQEEPPRRALRARRTALPRPRRATGRRVTSVTENMPRDVKQALTAGATVVHHGGRRYTLGWPREQVAATLDSLAAAAAAAVPVDVRAFEGRRYRVRDGQVFAFGGEPRDDLFVGPDGELQMLMEDPAPARTPSPLATALGQVGAALDGEAVARDAERSDLAAAIRLLAEKPAPSIVVNVPEQKPPVVNIAPAQVTVEPPTVVVKTVPIGGAQMVAGAQEPRKPRRVRVEWNERGEKEYVEVLDDDAEGVNRT
jgi:hypothetical protein